MTKQLRSPKGKLLASPNKEEAKQALRGGVSPAEVMKRFGISAPSVYNYRREIAIEDRAAAEATKLQKPEPAEQNSEEEELFPEESEGDAESQPSPVLPLTGPQSQTSSKIRQNVKYAEPGEIAKVLAPMPAPITFKYVMEEIPLRASKMLEANILYQDMLQRGVVTEDISSVIVDAMGLLHLILVFNVTPQDGKITVEAKNGSSIRGG